MKNNIIQARAVIISLARANPRIVLMLNIALLLPLWLLAVAPLFDSTVENKSQLEYLAAEIKSLNKIKAQIITLNKENKGVENTARVSLLKQVEVLAQTNGVFGRIKRLNPVQKTIAGKKRKGLTLIMEETNLNEITPFLYALAHKSVLDITSINLRREGNDNEKEGMINVQLTVLGGV